MPIKKIQNYAKMRVRELPLCMSGWEMLTAHREALNEQIRQLQEHMTKLAGKIDFYRQEIERTSKIIRT